MQIQVRGELQVKTCSCWRLPFYPNGKAMARLKMLKYCNRCRRFGRAGRAVRDSGDCKQLRRDGETERFLIDHFFKTPAEHENDEDENNADHHDLPLRDQTALDRRSAEWRGVVQETPQFRDIPLECPQREEALANRFITIEDELLEEGAVPVDDTASLVKHQQRVFEAVYDPLRLDMTAAQQSVEVLQIHHPTSYARSLSE
jgi:hypothetical protein